MTDPTRGAFARLATATCVAAALALAAAPSGRAAENWQQVYAKTLAAARQEGTVVVSGPPGAAQRRAIVEGWKKAFPKITLEYTGARGTQITAKIVRERMAGLYNWDVILASTNPTAFTLVPIHALAPLRDALIDPSLMDDKTWIGGFATGFQDKEKMYLYSPTGTGLTLGFVNRACMPKSNLSNGGDLMSPALKGKIVWFDPRRPGSGSRSTWRLTADRGEAWLEKLFKTQDIVFSRDYRQMADWVVGCHKPVGIGMPDDVIVQMKRRGVGAQVEELTGPAYFGKGKPAWQGANDHIAWFVKPPHPNAAKIFVNWYLSKDFQQEYADIYKTNSRRRDVKPGDPNPHHAIEPDIAYVDTGDEAATVQIKALQAKIKSWGVLK